MLELDGADDTGSAEDVFACCDEGVGWGVVADGAVILALDEQTESVLEEGSVLVVEGNDFVLVKEVEDVGDTFLAEGPVVTAEEVRRGYMESGIGDLHLAEAEESLEDVLKAALLS